jgi:hypothetical protein
VLLSGGLARQEKAGRARRALARVSPGHCRRLRLPSRHATARPRRAARSGRGGSALVAAELLARTIGELPVVSELEGQELLGTPTLPEDYDLDDEEPAGDDVIATEAVA